MTHGGPDATMTAMAPIVEPGSVAIGIAIAVPEPCASQVREAREAFGDPQARSVPTHVTLLAPTHVPSEMLAGIEEHLAAAARAAQPFRITLRGTGTFRPVSAVVFLALAEGIAGCEQLERSIRSGPLLRRRNFPYHPHVTLVQEVPEAALDAAFTSFADHQFSFQANHFTLFRQDDAQVWQPVREFSLG